MIHINWEQFSFQPVLHGARVTQSHSLHPLTIHSSIRLQTHSHSTDHSLIPQAHAVIPLYIYKQSHPCGKKVDKSQCQHKIPGLFKRNLYVNCSSQDYGDKLLLSHDVTVGKLHIPGLYTYTWMCRVTFRVRDVALDSMSMIAVSLSLLMVLCLLLAPMCMESPRVLFWDLSCSHCTPSLCRM